MKGRYTVAYTVDVIATIEDGEVVAVNVADEDIHPTEPPRAYTDFDGGQPVRSAAKVAKLYAMADEADWPAWEFGF